MRFGIVFCGIVIAAAWLWWMISEILHPMDGDKMEKKMDEIKNGGAK